MTFASGPGPLAGDIPPGITLLALRDSCYVLFGCAGLLLVASLVLALVQRKEPRQLWQRRPVIVVAAMSTLAVISAGQAWSSYQSFAHYGLAPNAGYLDWYEHFGQPVADQLDSAVGGFGTYSFLFTIATLLVLCAVGEQIVMSLRARRLAISRGIP